MRGNKWQCSSRAVLDLVQSALYPHSQLHGVIIVVQSWGQYTVLDHSSPQLRRSDKKDIGGAEAGIIRYPAMLPEIAIEVT